tara:strand:+ start:260 stop:412 length:153 start_codon:yes stop_codon:yes gene_type:complete
MELFFEGALDGVLVMVFLMILIRCMLHRPKLKFKKRKNNLAKGEIAPSAQ